jgi:hypothetical protein
MSFVYLKLSDARSSRTLDLPRVGMTITFGVSVDAASGESFVQYPALSASEVARLGGGAATIKAQRDSTGGGAVLSFTGPRPAVSNGTLLSPNVPYAFDENESFTFYGTIGSILTGGTLRGRGDIGDGRQVVVMATGFILDELTLSYLHDKGARVLYDLEDIPHVTHLVAATAGNPPSCGGARRTAKLLAAASLQSVQIVNYSWLLDSIRGGCDFQNASREVYVPRDPAIEAAHAFTFARLTSSTTCLPLSGVAVFVGVHGGVAERVAELQAVVQFAGGSIIERPECCEGATAAGLVVVAALFDECRKPDWFRDSHKAIDGEGILRAICNKETLDVEAWSLDVPVPPAAAPK